jgi:hypothetical protein
MLHDDILKDRDSIAAPDFFINSVLPGLLLFLKRQLEELLTISEDRMAGEVVDTVADAVVDDKGHLPRRLEEEVSPVINEILVIDFPIVLLIETAKDVALPLTQVFNPLDFNLRVNQASAPSRTNRHPGPCGLGGGLLLTSDHLRNNVGLSSSNRR